MSYTREERQLIDKLVKRVIKLSDRQAELVKAVDTIENHLDDPSTATIGTLSKEELIPKIKEAVEDIIKQAPIKVHSHLSNQEGGPAFARKGATLIDD